MIYVTIITKEKLIVLRKAICRVNTVGNKIMKYIIIIII